MVLNLHRQWDKLLQLHVNTYIFRHQQHETSVFTLHVQKTRNHTVLKVDGSTPKRWIRRRGHDKPIHWEWRSPSTFQVVYITPFPSCFSRIFRGFSKHLNSTSHAFRNPSGLRFQVALDPQFSTTPVVGQVVGVMQE